ncbi:MAG: BLUF domain-containing protein [Acidisphaera sp.]|nr:BLUF domain-containing protein [Acidisphaera sp.]
MSGSLHRIVYCSRNALAGSAASVSGEIRDILALSRANNRRDGITGALLYSGGVFAQVLEGRLDAIEGAFERIQRDPRHRDVTVLQIAPAGPRGFPDWSMAFAGDSAGRSDPATAARLAEALADPDAVGGEELLDLLRDLVVREDEWALAS